MERISVELKRAFETFVAPLVKCRSPLNQQTVGAIKSLTEHDMALRFVECSTSSTSGERDKCPLDRLVVRRLLYENVELRRVVLNGCDDDGPFKFGARPKVKEKKPKGSSSSAVDWCSDILQPASKPKAAVAPHVEPVDFDTCVDMDEGAVTRYMEDLGLDTEANHIRRAISASPRV